MDNKKMIETIEKKLEVKVEKVFEVTQNGKEVTVDVKVGDNNYRKVVLKEAKNQYGTYYRLVSETKYTRKRATNAPQTDNQPGGRRLCPDQGNRRCRTREYGYPVRASDEW